MPHTDPVLAFLARGGHVTHCPARHCDTGSFTPRRSIHTPSVSPRWHKYYAELNALVR